MAYEYYKKKKSKLNTIKQFVKYKPAKQRCSKTNTDKVNTKQNEA